MNKPKKMGRPRHQEPSYEAVHSRVYKAFGKASEHLCVDCLGPASQWAYLGDDSDPARVVETVVRRGSAPQAPGWSKECVRVYSTDLAMYSPMCKRCHRRFDGEKQCGHTADRLPKLVREYKDGRPDPRVTTTYCPACRSERERARRNGGAA